MKMYEVGGCVRDEILGLKSKDIDFTVVLNILQQAYCEKNDVSYFEFMSQSLTERGFEIFLETPEYLTIRARFPKSDYFKKYSGLTADFVLARKESGYSDGRRPDEVIAGFLEDDLARRDFTMNAIAKDPDTGEYIDLHGGIEDIKKRRIRAVGDPWERLEEDALRALRALRFAVTKDFNIESELYKAMNSAMVADAIANKISDERIQQELSKMFRYDSVKSMIALYNSPSLMGAAFHGTVSLDATMKTKGRG